MTNENEDPEVLRQQQEASEELGKLLEELGNPRLHIIINDWKAGTEHIREIAELLPSYSDGSFSNFHEWHPFEDGQGDDMVAVFTSKPVSYENAERIGNLVYNLGAEWEEQKHEDQTERTYRLKISGVIKLGDEDKEIENLLLDRGNEHCVFSERLEVAYQELQESATELIIDIERI